MPFPFYTSLGQQAESKPVDLPPTRSRKQDDPQYYRADDGLKDAVNVALLLGQPLLLTGEPGTGKTQLAYSLAWELGYGEPLVFETKSTSTAKDLFYTFDTLRRFHAVHTPGSSADNRDYLTYNALGLAILLSKEREELNALVPDSFMQIAKRRSIVLIDEVDKAPRDFPNDILNEIERLYFKVPELNQEVHANEDYRPVVVLTSNSEKHLPDAFLRRCVFYHIPFPEPAELTRIVTNRIEACQDQNGALLQEAVAFFCQLRRAVPGLNKMPATAELLGWVDAMIKMGASAETPLSEQYDKAFSALGVLVKNAEDQAAAKDHLSKFLD